MTIKKTIKKPAPAESSSAAPATGGAAIADRFKLAPTAPVKGSAAGGKAAAVALMAGLVALAVSGALAYILYQHWEFLMPA